VGPDDNIQGLHTDIRPPEEVAIWLEKDPIKKFERYMTKHGLMGKEGLQGIRDEVAGEVQAAMDFAINSAVPSVKDIKRDVFA